MILPGKLHYQLVLICVPIECSPRYLRLVHEVEIHKALAESFGKVVGIVNLAVFPFPCFLLIFEFLTLCPCCSNCAYCANTESSKPFEELNSREKIIQPDHISTRWIETFVGNGVLLSKKVKHNCLGLRKTLIFGKGLVQINRPFTVTFGMPQPV